LIQIISTVFIAVQAPEEPSFKKYFIDDSPNKFIFSSQKNVIMLILDQFQTDVFQEIIDEDSYYKDIFTGFTYFRNALAGFVHTYLSVPSILTGQYYDNSIPVQEFIKKEYTLNSIPKILKENGFQVNLYPYYKASIYFSEEIASNIKKRQVQSISLRYFRNYRKEIMGIYHVTLFRYLPHPFKKYVYNNQLRFLKQILSHRRVDKHSLESYPIHCDIRFMNKMEDFSTIGTDKYVFDFFHLRGMHPPLGCNERLEYENLPSNRQGYKKQAKAVLELTKIFLNTLDKIGIYDNSLIFVMADHGDGTFGIKIPEEGFIKNKIEYPIVASHVPRALPVILVKPFNSKKEMSISDAPVCLSDTPKTVFSELGLKGDFPGISMFEVKESDVRERRFIAFYSNSIYRKIDYFPLGKEYVIMGFSWFDESWRLTGRQFIPAMTKNY